MTTVGGRAVRYGAYPLVALAATVMLETGERGSLSQAVDGIQSQFGVSDLWIGALPAAMTLIGVFASIPFGHLADHMRRTYLLAFAMAVGSAIALASFIRFTYQLMYSHLVYKRTRANAVYLGGIHFGVRH